MSGMRQFRSLRRQVQIKEPRRKIVIYSEGEKTEKDYFDAIRRKYRNALIDIEIIEGAGVPFTIARNASQAALHERKRNAKQSFAKRDEFWAVFDRDEHPRVAEAIELCRSSHVGVAFSDPCFELWLLLHFRDFDRPDHRHDVQRHLEIICDDYDRNRRKTTDCERLMASVEAAEQRAERQLARRREEGDPPSRPFTTVFELTRRIRTES